ncbi:MAG: hypothetical protein PSV13_21005 [Lacunisphaera sp.]|nr:hypothetical protein [Lacunisphaera sp.]
MKRDFREISVGPLGGATWSRLSSGLAAKWLGQPRVGFLFKAMQQGARLLDQGQTDFERESSLS